MNSEIQRFVNNHNRLYKKYDYDSIYRIISEFYLFRVLHNLCSTESARKIRAATIRHYEILFGNCKISELTNREIYGALRYGGYKNIVQREGTKNSTVYAYIVRLINILDYASNKGWIDKNPLHDNRPIILLLDMLTRYRDYSMSEIEFLIGHQCYMSSDDKTLIECKSPCYPLTYDKSELLCETCTADCLNVPTCYGKDFKYGFKCYNTGKLSMLCNCEHSEMCAVLSEYLSWTDSEPFVTDISQYPKAVDTSYRMPTPREASVKQDMKFILATCRSIYIQNKKLMEDNKLRIESEAKKIQLIEENNALLKELLQMWR